MLTGRGFFVLHPAIRARFNQLRMYWKDSVSSSKARAYCAPARNLERSIRIKLSLISRIASLVWARARLTRSHVNERRIAGAMGSAIIVLIEIAIDRSNVPTIRDAHS
jgi:hypothetical protein